MFLIICIINMITSLDFNNFFLWDKIFKKNNKSMLCSVNYPFKSHLNQFDVKLLQ